MTEMVPKNGARVGGEADESTRRGEILRPAQIFDPVARALDLLGDRWTLVLVRQLLGGAKGFQELRVRTGIAPKVLSSRLRQLRSDGFVDTEEKGSRSVYCVTGKGRTLAPIISAIASWWVREGMGVREVDAVQFTETSALSVLEALPNLLREGGGVWTVEIDDGECSVREEFAAGADVRYTATARDWCAVAIGLLDAKEAVKEGLLHKEGGPQAMDEFFFQVGRPPAIQVATDD